ncbi:MAG: hypothetical protein LBP22_08810 [Deltaproteobacteria bacterium]|nr:hypothetical protein [Deltaproteobacteria bacterium]
MREKKQIYITVKTYPVISKEYSQLVCTAGILKDGSWIRLHPLPFPSIEEDKKFKKYTWIELEVEKNPTDSRPESYSPVNWRNLEPLQNGNTKAVNWQERKDIIFRNTIIYDTLNDLITENKKNGVSLAIFKPKQIIKFEHKEASRNWSENDLALLRQASQQRDLFKTEAEIKKEFLPPRKLPYRFSYKFIDKCDQESTMMIADWEIGSLYWNCLKGADNDEEAAIEKVKNKYFYTFTAKKDLYFFLGTTLKFDNMNAPNPFIIIGVFYPPIAMVHRPIQQKLF